MMFNGYTVFGFIAAIITLVIWLTVVEQNEWDQFANTHDCKVVGKQKSTTSTVVSYGMSSSGSMVPVIGTVSTPAKTGYLCNDDTTYWR